MNTKIITIFAMGVMAFTTTTVFSSVDYNSLDLNTSTVIVNQKPKPSSPATSALTDDAVKPSVMPTGTTVQPSAVSGSAPPAISTTATKKCGVNIFGVSNECGIGAFKNLYFQCYDGYEEKQGGGSSCKSSGVWNSYTRSVCANRCGTGQMPTTISTKPLPMPSPTIAPQIAKPIAICYISDKLTKDYNLFLLDLRKAESDGDKETAELIIKKITALKLEIERVRKKCLATAVQSQPNRPSTEVSRPLGLTTTIDRCREVAQWESKIVYYKKLFSLSASDLKDQTGFSKEEIEKILINLPIGLEKVRVQCQVQSGRTIGAGQVTEILKQAVAVSQISIAEPIKPVVVESGQEINDYYKARIEKIILTENSEEQIQNLRLLKKEIDELIVKFIKGRKEIEISEFTNIVTEIKVSRGEIKVDAIVIKTVDKKIFLTIGDKLASVEPSARGVIVRSWNLDGKESIEVRADETSIKDNILRVGNSEVKLTANDVIESISKRPGRAKYANITLERGVILKEENGRAVYKIKETEPRKLFRFIPIRITKTLTVSAENGDLLDERLPWYFLLTTK